MNIALSLNTIKPYRVYRIVVSVFFFIAGLSFASWASRIPDIKNKLQLSEAGLGAVLFALPVGLMMSLPVSGWLVTRFGSRIMTIAAALLYPFTLVLLALAPTTAVLVVGLFFFGLFSNLLNIAMNTQAVTVEAMYGRSIMASFHGLWSLAGFTGALVGTFFVSSAIDPFYHFLFIALASAILVFVSYKYALPDEPSKAEKQPFFVKPDRYLLLLGLIAFFCMLCEGAMADWSGVYFHEVVHAPIAKTTLGYLSFTASMATGRFLGDWLAMKTGIKRMLQISGTLIAAGLLLSVLFPYLVTSTIGFLFVGFGVSSVVPIVYGVAGRSKSMPASVALAAVSSISFLGFLIGPPLIGFIAQATNMQFSFALIAILGFGITLLAGKVKN